MVSTMFASIGKRLRSARTERGLTLAELAGQTRISLAQIGSYERGDRQIGIEELLILAKALDKPVTWFLGIPDELTADSPDYAEMVRTIRSNTVTLIVCRDYDRLWRTDPLLAQVMALCREHGVQVYSLNQPVEPLSQERLKQGSSDSAMIMEALGGILAESENRTRVRRLRVGKEAVIRSGLTQLNNNPPYGYVKVKGSNLLRVDETEARWVRWMFERVVNDRWGYTKITKELNQRGAQLRRGSLWYVSTVSRIIRNPIYYGEIRWGGLVNPSGKHEPIVSREMWDRAQAVREVRSYYSARSADRVAPALASLLFCGYCGARMTYDSRVNTTSKPAVRCGRYAKTGGTECKCNYNSFNPIAAYVLQQVKQVLNNPAEWLAEREADAEDDNAAAQLEQINHELAVLAARYSRWNQAYEIGSITLDELMGHRSRIAAQTDELQRQRDAIAASERERASRKDTILELAPRLAELDNASDDTLRQIYNRLIKKVLVSRGHVPKIEWL